MGKQDGCILSRVMERRGLLASQEELLVRAYLGRGETGGDPSSSPCRVLALAPQSSQGGPFPPSGGLRRPSLHLAQFDKPVELCIVLLRRGTQRESKGGHVTPAASHGQA